MTDKWTDEQQFGLAKKHAWEALDAMEAAYARDKFPLSQRDHCALVLGIALASGMLSHDDVKEGHKYLQTIVAITLGIVSGNNSTEGMTRQ